MPQAHPYPESTADDSDGGQYHGRQNKRMQVELTGVPVSLGEDDDVHAVRSGRMRNPSVTAGDATDRAHEPVSQAYLARRPALAGLNARGNRSPKELALCRQPRCHGSQL